jgi:small subunit ribosomal protein S6
MSQSQNREYELVYIVSPESSEQETNDLHTQVEHIVQRFNGTIEKTDNWGRRKLAYEIGHHREGTYVVETIRGSGELMKEIDRRLRVTDAIIRHLIVRIDEDLRVAERQREARKASQARRRVARGLPPEPEAGERRGDRDMEDEDDRMEGLEVQR